MAKMWRVPSSKVVQAGKWCFVEDKGMLTSAPTGSKGNYLFSEVGAGVKPLALIGKWHEINSFCDNNQTAGIENLIESLPHIYMGVTWYKPGNRFKMLDPVGDSIVAVTSGLVGLGGGALAGGLGSGGTGALIADTGGGIADIVGLVRTLGGKKKKEEKHSLSTTPLYVIFSYLCGKGMAKIGKKYVDFATIKTKLRDALT